MAHTFNTRSVIRILILICLAAALPGRLVQAAPGDTTRVSVDSAGAQTNAPSRRSVISADGNYVAFSSEASNLVIDDTNGLPDVFLHDRRTGLTERISLADDESQANNYSEETPAVSADGRYVAFTSMASNLVGGDTNGMMDVFVRDRQLGQTTRISVDSSGAQTNGDEWADYSSLAMSSDGRFVAFASDVPNLVGDDTNTAADVFVHDRQTGSTTRLSVASNGEQGNDGSYNSDLSGDGNMVVFRSGATNLVSGDLNGMSDVFLHNTLTGETTLVSVSSSGEQANRGGGEPSISDDGRSVAFSSAADNLAPDYLIGSQVYVRDLATGQTTRASVHTDGSQMAGSAMNPALSADGRYVAFEYDDRGDGLSALEIYVHDCLTGQTASITEQGITEDDRAPYGPSISADGNFVAFQSGVSSLVEGDTNGVLDVFVRADPFYDNPPPTVVSITRTDPSPTSAASVRFTVVFSEPVTGVDPGDFTFAFGGTLRNPTVTGVSGSGMTYTVTVAPGTGSGEIWLHVRSDATIVDSGSAPLAEPGYFENESYTIDRDVPLVTGIRRDNSNPTFTGRSASFTVSFSEAVAGVDKTDFRLTKSAATTAAITSVSGSGSTYTVTISTGNTKNTLRLDLIDNDTIRDVLNQPLGGTGAGNGNFTTGESYSVRVLTTVTFRSNGTNDGYVLESGEDTSVGGSLNATATTFYVGDNAQDYQFRAFLHFPTSTLPDNAVILQVTLKIRKLSLTGTDPFTTHQNLLVDIRYGPFSGSNALQVGDFQAPASLNSVGIFPNAPSGSWYSSALDGSAFPYVSLTGVTQFRLAFQLDDDEDLSADTIKFYSGNYGDLAYRPQLEIQYYVP